MLGAKCGVHKDIPAGPEDARGPGHPGRRPTPHPVEPGKTSGNAEGHPRTQEAAQGRRHSDDWSGARSAWSRAGAGSRSCSPRRPSPSACRSSASASAGWPTGRPSSPTATGSTGAAWPPWAGRSAASSARASGRWTMAGKVFKVKIFSPGRWVTLLPDLRMLRFWFFRRRRDNARRHARRWGSSPSSPARAWSVRPPWTFARSCSCAAAS